MEYIKKYKTPTGFSNIIMRSDGKLLTGLWFENTKDSLKHDGEYVEKSLPIFDEVTTWLDIYFSGEEPKFTPKYKICNITPFRKDVKDIMKKIPYGQVVTYGDIAKEIATKKGVKKMSAQAIGGAVGANPICIIVPCHRVVGSNGKLVGYGGGIENKEKLLQLEGKKYTKINRKEDEN